MARPSTLLSFESVGKRFGDIEAVCDLNLEIGRGGFVAIMGPSGCGKTTTLRLLAGLERPTTGRIMMDGRPIDDVPPWRREMPLVWQSYALFPFLNVLDNVAFGLKSRKVPKAERRRQAQAWLDRLGIGGMARRSPGTLSGGQAQRVALARALVLEPEVLILDEPLSALDAHMVIRMQSELAELQRTLGITFLYVTHNQSEAFAMADRVVIMNQGRIEQAGAPLDIYRAPRSRFVAEFVGANNILSCCVSGADDDGLLVETALGTFATADPTGLAPTEGGKACLVIGADMVSVEKQGSVRARNRFDARLVGESFSGNIVTLLFEAKGEEVRVQLQERALRDLDLRPGASASLSFDPAETLLVPAG